MPGTSRLTPRQLANRRWYTKNREAVLASRKLNPKDKAATKAFYEKNREAILAGRHAQRADPKTWAKAQMPVLRNRARSKGLDFDLTADDIVVPEYCPILGIKLIVVGGHFTAASPSVDRVDSSRGYVRGNVRVISYRANRLKSNMTLKEVEAMLRYMRQDVYVECKDRLG